MRAYNCVICHNIFSGYGNNAEPYREGRCCDSCNEDRVIPRRIALMLGIPTVENNVYRHTFYNLQTDAQSLLSIVQDNMGYVDTEVRENDDNSFDVVVCVFSEEYDKDNFINDVEYWVNTHNEGGE